MASSRAEAARQAVQQHAPKCMDEDMVNYVADMAASLLEDDDADPASILDELESTVLPLFEDLDIPAADAKAFCAKVVPTPNGSDQTENGTNQPQGGNKGTTKLSPDCLVHVPNLLLMYGGSPLPLLKNATLSLARGHRYGVIGSNGSGKTTLMARIASKDIVGFPQDCRVVHLRHEAILRGVSLSTTARNYARLRTGGADGASDEDVLRALKDVGFDDDESLNKAVGSLSGGWQMRLALACAMAQKANLLLLDEPTNHLDTAAVQWLVGFINKTCVGGETGGTAIIVSHDSAFLNDVCTDIIHFTSDAKLEYHHGDFDAFKFHQLGGDEAKAQQLLEVGEKKDDNDTDAFAMPEIDRLLFPNPEKIKNNSESSDSAVLKISNMTFQHPGATAPVLKNVSVELKQHSRVGIIGKNGSGKSTLLSLLAGRLQPDSGTVWSASALRLVYVSQHHESQLGEYMPCTPHEYIQLRFKKGYDADVPQRPYPVPGHKELSRIKALAKQHGKRGKEVEAILSRQITNHANECLYEVKWRDLTQAENTFEKQSRLKGLNVEFMVHHFNQMMNDAWGEEPVRLLTDREVCKHLEDFGLPEDVAHNRRISMLSSGQKSKLLLAASFWTRPHIVCLDEPTNYLDPDTVSALSRALQKFKGGYVVVSHHQAFVDEIAEELWEVSDGQVTVRAAKGGPSAAARAADEPKQQTAPVAQGKARSRKRDGYPGTG